MQRISGFLGASPIGSLLLAGSLLLTACESKPATSAVSPADSTQPVVATAYVCPMGCEGSASNSPGKCPVCDMALEHNPEYKAPVTK